MRIAYGGISVENGSFSPLHTTLDDFVVLRGEELSTSERYPFLNELEADFAPTLFARSWPGGELERAAYETLKDELLERLSACGSVDGLYLDLHGAMKVVGMEDAEADLASAVREIVGSDALISASMDLHGNISQAYITQIDLLSAYRTAPHRDALETRERACRLLVDAIAGGQRPHIVCKPIPILLSGEQTRTDMAPGNRLWASLPEIEKQPEILDASLFVGFAWVDEPRSHAAAVVTALDEEVAEQAAVKLAQAYWDARNEFHYGVEYGQVDQCIKWAISAAEPTVFISDSGDNPTAGATGDIPYFVDRLVAHRAPKSIVAAIPDAETVAACLSVGIGATLHLKLGGKLDTLHGTPFPTEATVYSIIKEGQAGSDQMDWTQVEGDLVKGDELAGTQVVLQIENVYIIVTERRKPFTTLADFKRVGLDPLDFKIVVVKLGYLFPELLRIAPRALMALSPGASDLDFSRLPYQRIKRPMWPMDADELLNIHDLCFDS